MWSKVKFIYSEKATKLCEIFTVDLTVNIQVEISQKFVAFSEYPNFKQTKAKRIKSLKNKTEKACCLNLEDTAH